MASLMPTGKQQYFNPTSGRPLAGGLLYTYAAGTSTPKPTYQDAGGTTPNTNPITLDSTGSALVYWTGNYKVVLTDSVGNIVWTVDNYNTDQAAILGATLAGPSGANGVGYQHAASVNPTTVQAALRAELHNVNLYFIAGEADCQPMFVRALAAQKRVWVPPGTYNFNSSLPIPNNRILDGDGPDSILSFSVTGDGVTSTCPINSSTAANVTLSNLAITCTNGGNAGAGFDQVGGSYIDLYKVSFSGWKYGVIFDQTEIATIRNCQFLQPSYSVAGVWLVNGPDHTAGGKTYFTNRITVEFCQFNCAAGAQFNILDDGGVSHEFRGNNFNAGNTGIRAAGVAGLSITGANESEVHITEDIYLGDTTLAGAYTGPVRSFEIVGGNNLISGSGGRNITIQNAINGRISGNYFGQAAAAINFINGASNQSTGITIEGNGKILDGAGITAGSFLAGFSQTFRRNIIKQTAVTYIPTSTAAGTGVTITPANMEFISVGTRLRIANPDGTAGEDTIVTATTSTTFTCALSSPKNALAQVWGATPFDQEEGVWTPTIGATTTNGTHTYSAQRGQYSRRGNLVTAQFSIAVSAKDASLSGTVRVIGLPYVAENVSNGAAFANIALFDGFTLAGGYTHLSGVISPNTQTIDLRKSASGLTLNVVPATDIPGTTLSLYGEVTYVTSSL